MRHFLFILLLALTTGCNNKERVVYWVNSYQVECVGVGPMQCLLIQNGEELSEDKELWQNFYSRIIGFEFEPGYFYKLLVDETELNPNKVPADASSIKYTLVEILEKNPDSRFELNGKWEAISILNEPINLSDVEEGGKIPALEFMIEEMKFAGNDGCNNIFGPIDELGNETIEFGLVGSTMMFCAEDLDKNYKQEFDKVKRYKIEGNQLILLDSEGAELLRYTRVE